MQPMVPATTEPQLTGAMLKDATTATTLTKQPQSRHAFTDEGARSSKEITTRMAETADITGTDQLLAIVLDGEVESARAFWNHRGATLNHRSSPWTRPRTWALVLQTGALPR